MRLSPATKLLVFFGSIGVSALTPKYAHAQILGSAADFGVLAGSTVSNTGPSVIQGSVGVSPGGAVVGFPPGIVLPPGVIHAADATASQAQTDLTTAYNTLMGMPSQVDLTGQDLGGLILTSGVYSFNTSAQLTGVVTLDGQGNPASPFVFQIGTTLTTASNSAVLLINGANGNNVYWTVGSSATLGTNTVFAGNIVALSSITLNTGASINCGRALARNGAVTLDNNTITLCVSGSGGSGTGGDDIPLNELFGEGVTGTQQTAFGASNLFASTMMGQGAFWRDGGQDAKNPDNDNQSLKDGPGSLAPNAYVNSGAPRTWRLWTTGFAGAAMYDGQAARDTADLDTRIAGFALGLDYQVDRSALVGVAGGYTNSHFSIDQRRTSGDVEGAHVGLYAVKTFGRAYVAASADYAHFSNDTDRSIDWVLDEQAQGDFDSEQVGARVEAGWRTSVRGLGLTPFVGFQASHLQSEGFTEDSQRSGGPGILGLTFRSHRETSLVSSLGLQLDSRVAMSAGRSLQPFARVAWLHEFDADREADAFLTSSPTASFTVEGASASSDLAKVNLGVNFQMTERAGLFAYAEGELSGQSQSYSGNGGFRLTW
ncbi:MAG: ice-binding family protein [Hyphomicrobiaceae bacterium]|nr:ice-binding family protein [Hyphomicrobiaceae bacterium]